MSVFMVSALLFSGCGIHGTDNVKKEEDNENNNIVKLRCCGGNSYRVYRNPRPA